MSDTANGEDLHDAIVEIDPALYRRVLGHYPTGVVVVAGVDDGHPIGLAIGSFFSVSLEPSARSQYIPRPTQSAWA